MLCEKCRQEITEGEETVSVRTGPPGFADHASFHAACVGGRVVTQGQRGEFV